MTLVIAGGRVQIEDGIKKAEEYAPPRKALVEIRFEVPEGADGPAMAQAAAEQAQSTLSYALSGVVSAASSKPAPAARVGRPAAQPKPADKPKDAPEPGSKAYLEAKALAEAQTPAKAPVVPVDEIDDLLGDTAPVPVTDAELGKAAQDKNAKMKAEHGDKWAPAKLRTLITEFAGEGKRINDIPAAKRHEFVEKLKALTI